MSSLFDTIQMGDLALNNRIVMSPLTRCRAPGRIANALMVEYYRQRASAGLIISEATAILPMGVGYPDTPGIWSDEQVKAWQPITEAVHQAGGKIVCQLWHVGRVSHPHYLNGETPVSSSAVALRSHVRLLRPQVDYPVPRALEINEIPAIIEAYRTAAQNAKAAGFDGVELHGANGYLPDQFLQSSTNQRTDAYGGPIEHRARFMLEATDALISVWGASRVGVHLSPGCDTQDMGDDDPAATFGYLVDALNQRDIAFIFSREDLNQTDALTPQLRKRFNGTWIGNMNLSPDSASQLLADNTVDAVAFGRDYIATPDLVTRLQNGSALNEGDHNTYYSPGSAGYTDYPTLDTAD
ncbi:alkene reductase [Oceanobacter sp. 4_MG-2023]|uniref:alkene reductase n=1 Tax=Oceanobacter sp. 4_MG-2023 TaxID=3062623 RepID=UPI002734C499|nr:alkene reductase [Oceanobacter sp. 4_MG-2023]MDP2547686.1 alkene reductase [Oceanobacter sp. 4_MG-2023]